MDFAVSDSSGKQTWKSIVVDGRVEKEKEHNDEQNEQPLVRPHIQICMRNSRKFLFILLLVNSLLRICRIKQEMS